MEHKKNTKFAIIITILCIVNFLLSGFLSTEAKQQKSELFSNLPTVQYPNFHELGMNDGWPQVYDGGDEDMAYGIVIDSNGNVTVTGYSLNTSSNRYNALTIQYDTDGNELWKNPLQNGGYTAAIDIAVDSYNNLIILGWSGTTLADLINLTGEIFIVKYNNKGVEQWNISLHKDKYIYPGGITVDSHDNIIITGWTGNDLTKSCWTIKMDNNGQELWNKTYHEDMEDYGIDISIDSYDTIITAGFWTVPGSGGTFIIKYASNGSMLWTKRPIAEINQALSPYAVTVDLNDNIILSGEKYSYTTYTNVMCTQKFDSSGSLLWTREYNSGYTDIAKAVTVDTHNHIIVGGWSSFSTLENIEQCVVIYNEDGNELCIKRPGIQGQIFDVAVHDDKIFVTGYITNGNSSDYYIDKYLDVTPPSVTLNKPKENYLYIFDRLALPRIRSTTTNTIMLGKITETITATNPSDIDKAEFYIDTILKETVNASPFQWVWNEVAFGGQHQVKIMVYDHSGCIKKFEFTVRKFL